MCELCIDKFKTVAGASVHSHTEASSDGISPTSELIDRSIAMGQKSMAITDHYEMSAFVGASSYIQANKLQNRYKVVAGCEIYLNVSESFTEPKVTHLTVLGDGIFGYNQLVRMQSKASNRVVNKTTNTNFYKRPPTHEADLFEFSEGLVVLSGCTQSVFNDESLYDDNVADEYYTRFSRKFKGRFYVEVMLYAEIDDRDGITRRIQRALYYARKYNLPVVVSNDIHFAEKHQAKAHKYFTSRVLGFNYKDEHLYLKTSYELAQRILELHDTGDEYGEKITLDEASILLEGILESERLLEKLDGVLFDGKMRMPSMEFDIPLKNRVYSEYHRHLSIVDYADAEYKKETKKRMDYELGVIEKMGFNTYFQIVIDMNWYVESTGGKVGYGRGSCGGSFVAFLLGFVKLNPILHGFYFERFLNIGRGGSVDIDLDYAKEDRLRLVQYMSDKYNAVPAVTHHRYHHDGLINDIARDEFLNLTSFDVKELKKNEVTFRETDVWKKMRVANKNIDLIYDNLLGVVRNNSKHAGASIVHDESNPYELPVTINKHGEILCAIVEGGAGEEVTHIGSNKFDILGNDGLNHLARLEKVTGVTAPDLSGELPDNVLEVLNDPAQLDGIFQVGGAAVRDYVPMYGIRNFQDVVDITAIRRSGVMEAGTDVAVLKHRPIEGLPKRKSNGVNPDGRLLELTLEDGTTFNIHENWYIMTQRGWVVVNELTEDDELEIE